MLQVDFRECQCRMFLLFNISPVACRIQVMPMSHVTILFELMSMLLKVMSPVEFKK